MLFILSKSAPKLQAQFTFESRVGKVDFYTQDMMAIKGDSNVCRIDGSKDISDRINFELKLVMRLLKDIRHNKSAAHFD